MYNCTRCKDGSCKTCQEARRSVSYIRARAKKILDKKRQKKQKGK